MNRDADTACRPIHSRRNVRVQINTQQRRKAFLQTAHGNPVDQRNQRLGERGQGQVHPILLREKFSCELALVNLLPTRSTWKVSAPHTADTPYAGTATHPPCALGDLHHIPTWAMQTHKKRGGQLRQPKLHPAGRGWLAKASPAQKAFSPAPRSAKTLHSGAARKSCPRSPSVWRARCGGPFSNRPEPRPGAA
jgi:hypothetical protein